MHLRKLIISLLLTLFSFFYTYSQQEPQSLSANILKLVTELNNQINVFFEREKIEKLDRQLGYLNQDLEGYLSIRKDLMDYLNGTNYNLSDSSRVLRSLTILKRKLSNLTESLNNLKPLLNNQLSGDVSRIVREIKQVAGQNRVVYITELEKYYRNHLSQHSKRKINTEKLKADGERIYKDLVQSTDLISSIQAKLRVKLR